jgi:hypothetical protein
MVDQAEKLELIVADQLGDDALMALGSTSSFASRIEQPNRRATCTRCIVASVIPRPHPQLHLKELRGHRCLPCGAVSPDSAKNFHPARL